MGEKVTIMVLNVDLQCPKCFKKVKRVLCKFPQIQEQIYDEKNNKVTIKVVCCSPEKIAEMLCCKGEGAIQSIDIMEPQKPKEKQSPPPLIEKPAVTKPDNPPVTTVDRSKPPPSKENELALVPCYLPGPKPVRVCCRECYEGRRGGQCYHPAANPVRDCCRECYEGRRGGPCYHPAPNPIRDCCRECYEGRGGGPCYRPALNPVRDCCAECYEGRSGGPCYHLGQVQLRYDVGYYGKPVYDSWGGEGGGRSRCTVYISEENPNACTIM